MLRYVERLTRQTAREVLEVTRARALGEVAQYAGHTGRGRDWGGGGKHAIQHQAQNISTLKSCKMRSAHIGR